jgi:hypothetical protein
MRNAVLLAAVLAFGVLMLFVGFILAVERPAAEKNGLENAQAATPRLVPSLECIAQDKDAGDKSAKDATIHTKAPIPKLKIFQTSYKEGTQVTFNHAQHVDKHKLQCIDCHHVERCSKCHVEGGTHSMQVVKGKQALHESCITCHAETSGPEKCVDCHKQ